MYVLTHLSIIDQFVSQAGTAAPSPSLTASAGPSRIASAGLSCKAPADPFHIVMRSNKTQLAQPPLSMAKCMAKIRKSVMLKLFTLSLHWFVGEAYGFDDSVAIRQKRKGKARATSAASLKPDSDEDVSDTELDT